MLDYAVICGSSTGIIKAFSPNCSTPVSISAHNGHVKTLCWAASNIFYAGTADGVVRSWDCVAGCGSEQILAINDPIVSLHPDIGHVLCVSSSGLVKSMKTVPSSASKIEFSTTKLSVSRYSRPLLATGGKDSNLHLWNIESPTEPVFHAKNVRPSTLQLESPVWISDINFIPNTNDKLILTASRIGEFCLYDVRCNQRRPVSRHSWRMSRKYGKLQVGKCVHGAMLPDLNTTRPITRCVAFNDAPGVGVRVVAGNAIGDLCFLDLRVPTLPTTTVHLSDSESTSNFKSVGARAPEPPLNVRNLHGASGSITNIVCSGAGDGNLPFVNSTARFHSQPLLITSSLDRFLRIYNRDTGCRLAKLYAKVPITSFLVANSTCLSDFTQISADANEASIEDEPEADHPGDDDDDVEFDQLWDQMEPIVQEEVQSKVPRRKKLKRKHES